MTTLVDDRLGLDWPANVSRNWEHYGFFTLHGQLVVNPGGHRALEQPEVYAGHRPASLYPLFLSYHLFKWLQLDFLPYYFIVATLVFFSIWQLTGRSGAAFWLAICLLWCPGYVRWQTTMDPNLAAVMWGYPFCAIAFALLQKKKLRVEEWMLLGLVTALYSLINWSAVLVHAMIFMALLLHPRVSRPRLAVYAGVAATVGLVVLGLSVASKMTMANGQPAPSGSLLKCYCWGNEGYGADLTTRTAIMRLTAVNLTGLLPVLLFLGWHAWRKRAFQR